MNGRESYVDRKHRALGHDQDDTDRVREDAARSAKATAIAHAWHSIGQPSGVLAGLVEQARETIDTDGRKRARKALELVLEVASVKFSSNPKRAQRPWTEASSQTWAQALGMLRFDEHPPVEDPPDEPMSADELFRRL